MQNRARNFLRQALNSTTAEFREGQWEAIAQIAVKRERLLVVQRTGWGGLVRDGKIRMHHYDDQLVEAARELVERRWKLTQTVKWVTCIPSIRHTRVVPDFAGRLAAALKLPFRECIQKTHETRAQKEMQNSYQQAHNLSGAFAIVPDNVLHGPVLLVDDMVDSGWTFTIATALLREAGSGPVYPFALAKVISS